MLAEYSCIELARKRMVGNQWQHHPVNGRNEGGHYKARAPRGSQAGKTTGSSSPDEGFKLEQSPPNLPLFHLKSTHLSQEPPLAPTSCRPQFQRQTPKRQLF